MMRSSNLQGPELQLKVNNIALYANFQSFFKFANYANLKPQASNLLKRWSKNRLSDIRMLSLWFGISYDNFAP